MFDLLVSLRAICLDESRSFSQREHAYLLLLSLVKTYRPRRNSLVVKVIGHPALNEHEIWIGKNEGKIPCLKAYKERTGRSLLEAKQVCEHTFEKLGYKFKGH